MSTAKKDPLNDELTVEEAPIKWVLNLRDLPQEGIRGDKHANEEELQALTKLLNDEFELEVISFVCTYHVKPGTLKAGKDVGRCLIEGCRGHFEITAKLRQTCVVSLERIDTLVEERFDQEFSSKGGHRPTVVSLDEDGEDLFADEPPMKIIKGKVELGPLVYQYLSMAIDGNPRKSGAQFEEKRVNGDVGDEKPLSPFNVLEQFKHKK